MNNNFNPEQLLTTIEALVKAKRNGMIDHRESREALQGLFEYMGLLERSQFRVNPGERSAR